MQTKWIEQKLTGYPDFGSLTCATITKNGLGINQLMLRIVLPDLQSGYQYKKLCIYDLINFIEITVENISIKLGSVELKMLDNVERDMDKITTCATMINNTIYYPIDLKYFFGKSKSTDHNLISMLPLDFEGIRLVDMKNADVCFFVKFNSIRNIITYDYFAGYITEINRSKNITSGDNTHLDTISADNPDTYHIVDTTIWVHYSRSEFSNINEKKHTYITTKEIDFDDDLPQPLTLTDLITNPMSFFYPTKNTSERKISCLNIVEYPKITQDICTWIGDKIIPNRPKNVNYVTNSGDKITGNNDGEITEIDNGEITKVRYLVHPRCHVTKIILNSTSLSNISTVRVLYNRSSEILYESNMDMHRKIYEYNNKRIDENTCVFDVDLPAYCNGYVVELSLINSMRNFEANIMYNKIFKYTYINGVGMVV